ncbi:hypothetical protein [Mesorhizobium onobrychidis]|uniref:Uncharacterized protein n=1 Tax=Mesorhizobium onobrychidis TaxID=2775404 RepID=A0ABY5QNM6_9HYPH|nr:hypothetical protein [Mesorhizobium onobrychidis]UVC12750.1 hypothetical protein IHQ72_18370 [Mesorhizobium onobrychidis]
MSASGVDPPQAGILLSWKKRREDFFEEFAKIFRLAIKQRPAPAWTVTQPRIVATRLSRTADERDMSKAVMALFVVCSQKVA